MDRKEFESFASAKCAQAYEKKQDIECERNEDIADQIGSMLCDRLIEGEKDAGKLMKYAEELAGIASEQWRNAECEEDDGGFAANLLSLVLWNAAHDRIYGLTTNEDKNEFVIV